MLTSRLRLLDHNDGLDRSQGMLRTGSLSWPESSALSGVLGKPQIPSAEITTLPERDGTINKVATLQAPPVHLGTIALPASTISVPSTALIEGGIAVDEIDFFGFNLVAGQTYLFSAFGSGATPLEDTFLYLADGGFNLIDFDDDGGSGTNSLLTFTADTTGLYIIGVGAFPDSGLAGDYTIDAVLQPPTDVVSDDPLSASPLTIGTVEYGFLEAGFSEVYGPDFSEVDTFSFTVEAGKIYTFEIAGGADYASLFFDLPLGELDTLAVIYDAEGNILAANDDISFPDDISSRVSFFATESGTVYLDVLSYQPWTGGYSITSSSLDPADFDPLDSIIWRDADNVTFDATNTAYVYFAAPGESFGELADNGIDPLPSLGWTEFEKQQVMLAFEEYEKILGVNYVITEDPGVATFRLITTESDLYGAYMYPQDPAFGTQQGIAAFNTLSGGWAFDQQQSLLQGGFSFSTILHELGHGHGLAHPHDTGGGSDVMLGVDGPFGSLGVYDLNQGVYTVMSYNDAWQLHPDGPSPFTADGVDNGWVGTLSAFDIAALQERYGVINAFATGNNVYTLQGENVPGTYYETIWDTGGADVISYAGASDARIDLLAATIDYSPTGGGVLSFVDGVWGGFTIARGVVIENATGGAGDDSLLGNAVANVLTGNVGDDILVGRGGADTLNGGAGIDTASYIDASTGVRASLDYGRGFTGDAAGDKFYGIEGLQGSNFNDTLTGDKRANTLAGMNGDDTLDGGDGADILLGGGGRDTLIGGKGVDNLDGGAGDDKLSGDDGDDTMFGAAGNDTLSGGKGKDALDGGDGDDRLTGGDGADRLSGGLGDDWLSGGDGNDIFVFADLNGNDTIADFDKRHDRVDLSGTGLTFDDLDTSGNGTLDKWDEFVSVSHGRIVIDLGASLGGSEGIDTLTLLSNERIPEGSFIFGGG